MCLLAMSSLYSSDHKKKKEEEKNAIKFVEENMGDARYGTWYLYTGSLCSTLTFWASRTWRKYELIKSFSTQCTFQYTFVVYCLYLHLSKIK